MFALSYSKFELPSGGTYKVYYRNGTVSLYSNFLTTPTFLRNIIAPTSYFLWHTATTLQDGSKVVVFSNFTTVTIGPSLPNTPEG